jgi:Outer membrane protein beta-barrel domain
MKQLVLTGLLLLLLQASGFSQRFYVRAGGGYSWPSGPQHMTSNYQVNYASATNSFTEAFAGHRGSYGTGLTGSVAVGYRFTDQLWAEAGAAYLAGKTYQGAERYSGSIAGEVNSETYARMPALAASLVVSPAGRHWRPYAKAGILVGRPRIYNQDTEAFDGDVVHREWEIRGKKAWGFQGGLGIHYGFNARVGLFLEGLFRSLSFIPEKGRVTRYTKNGQDQYSTLTVRQRELEYRDSYTRDSSSQPPADQPGQTGNDAFPFGSAGLQLGVQLQLR